MSFIDLAKAVIPFNTRRRMRFYQNRIVAFAYSLKDIIYRFDTTLHPVPPPRLRFRVHGDMDLLPFVSVGRQCAKDVQSIMELAGAPIPTLKHILDFGCGCGRTLNWLSKESPALEFVGTDIDEESVSWCRQNYAKIKFHVNEPSPPLPFSSNTFDLIYAISVFSHLDEEGHLAWLEELYRILRPDGYLLISFHGKESQSYLSDRERSLIKESGYLYKVEGHGKYKLDGLPDSYQSAYISDEYIYNHWSNKFEVKKIIDKGMNDHQSVVLLYKN